MIGKKDKERAMWKCVAGAVLLIGAGWVSGCATPGKGGKDPAILTPAERTAMQTRTYAAPQDTVWAATLDVLLDLQWNVSTADRATGLLRATTHKRQEALSPTEERLTDFRQRKRTVQERSAAMKKWSRWEALTIHTESWGANQTRQRMILTRCGARPSMTYRTHEDGGFLRRGDEVLVNAPVQEETVEVDLPEVYADVFDRIEKAVRLRLSR